MREVEKAPQSEVLIGSCAVRHHLGDVLGRPSKDRDIMSFQPVAGSDWVDGQGILDLYTFEESVASPSEVYTLKVSHSPWVIAGLQEWYKHLRDIQTLKSEGADVVEELHAVAYREWERRKGAKNVNLNQDKDSFFNGGVKRYYDHDSVHEAMALGAAPAFNKILEEGASVKTSRKRFELLSDEAKSFLVFEEVMVLALERELIPRHEAGRPVEFLEIQEAYRKHLRLLVTQYSKGWFPRWIIENYFSVSAPPLNYWEMFRDSNKVVRL